MQWRSSAVFDCRHTLEPPFPDACTSFSHVFARCRFGDRAEETLEQATYFVTCTKACPTCGVRIEKVEGCNHVICSNCHDHMCWICGAHIVGYDHFKEGKCSTFDDLRAVVPAATAKDIASFLTKKRAAELAPVSVTPVSSTVSTAGPSEEIAGSSHPRMP